MAQSTAASVTEAKPIIWTATPSHGATDGSGAARRTRCLVHSALRPSHCVSTGWGCIKMRRCAAGGHGGLGVRCLHDDCAHAGRLAAAPSPYWRNCASTSRERAHSVLSAIALDSWHSMMAESRCIGRAGYDSVCVALPSGFARLQRSVVELYRVCRDSVVCCAGQEYSIY